MKESSLGWYRGESQKTLTACCSVPFMSPEFVPCELVEMSVFIMSMVLSLGERQFLLFITNNSQPPNINFLSGNFELFARCGSSPFDAVDRKGIAGKKILSVCCPFFQYPKSGFRKKKIFGECTSDLYYSGSPKSAVARR
ncbi:hypothetical protein TNIN_236301 [Trichonephila inaurata madagascariensis]|uniref:Uncharacterized protein n=1 Tax=Trichonephila inaurata madagascariensis TaxID=2747483 RepID=A0A8X6YSQ6_9ARAC|nr:hypothetical protein TNIN_236301 [Trichonephila inaurata madagascariensis]